MPDKKKTAVNVTGIDTDLHADIKKAAIDKGITVNEMYLGLIVTGAKRRNIVK